MKRKKKKIETNCKDELCKSLYFALRIFFFKILMGEFQFEDELVRNVVNFSSKVNLLICTAKNEPLKAILARVAQYADILVDTSIGPEGLIPVPKWVRMKLVGRGELDSLSGLDDVFPALSLCASLLLIPLSHASISPLESPCTLISSVQPFPRLASCPSSIGESMLVSHRMASCPRADYLLVSPSFPKCALQSSPHQASCSIAAALPQPILPLAPPPPPHLAAACSPTTHLSVVPISTLSSILASFTPLYASAN